ncbi:hypothetical protein [Streptomyces griseoviridis]|uniref:hypothetical protein n=1 Tax=Streptomyces griseoviridis TaxID=45398 RepID=UPI0034364AB2
MLLCGLAGLLLLVAAVVLLTGPLPGATAARDDYRSARPCPAGVGRDEVDCLRDRQATVVEAGAPGESWRQIYRRLSYTTGGHRGEVRLRGGGPVLSAAEPGDRITLTSWRGEVRAVTSAGVREETAAAPTRTPGALAATALALLIAAGMFCWCAYWSARRSRFSRLASPWQLVVPVVACALLAATVFVVGLFGPGLTEVLVFTAVATAVTATAATAVVLLTGRRRTAGSTRSADADSVEIAPERSAEQRCVPVSLSGDVPYDLHGFDYLVIGPGLLAVTTDPTGRVARRPVPPDLEAVRVRPPLRTDPRPPPHHTHLVVECRDGDTPVLIAADRQDIPWILGALRSGA